MDQLNRNAANKNVPEHPRSMGGLGSKGGTCEETRIRKRGMSRPSTVLKSQQCTLIAGRSGGPDWGWRAWGSMCNAMSLAPPAVRKPALKHDVWKIRCWAFRQAAIGRPSGKVGPGGPRSDPVPLG
eukprot:929423-Pyramimonas_sp.AAC.1